MTCLLPNSFNEWLSRWFWDTNHLEHEADGLLEDTISTDFIFDIDVINIESNKMQAANEEFPGQCWKQL